jgi:hypothetical protein
MMNQSLMNAESMVALTVVGSLVLSAAVLVVRSMLEKKPARQPVEIRRPQR